ncbi:YggT family protein [Olsenella sp. DSM 107455]|uniref:YggT family protein n=1 Tax=Thermophilibacter gallinarum TaxID=2779357 RepID=A0ABR9QSB3_9ACTN|nr:YggT family protein [Thermophilibacter gallinarum]MBE5023958.1 YggT family protein [Thermophilibacter gallinarum]
MGTYQIFVLVQKLFDIYGWLVVIWCLMTWFPLRPGSFVDDLRGAIGMLVEPYLQIFRRFIPPVGGIDWSPVVAILVLSVIERLLYTILL